MPESEVAGRRVIMVLDRDTQTVNVCDPLGDEGVYDWVVRLDSQTPVHAEVERTRTSHGSVEAFVRWLKENMSGRIERVPPDQDVLPATVRPATADPDPTTSADVTAVLEDSLDSMVSEFLRHPYTHRREHNLHSALSRRLKQTPTLAPPIQLIDGQEIDPLQQEWPELEFQQRLGSFDVHVLWPMSDQVVGPRLRKGRGRYDLAILAPTVMRACDVRRYLAGLDPPLFAVEFGLIEDYDHLRADAAKLVNNRVPFGYLVHFCRPEKVDNFAAVERLLELLSANSTIRSVYARVEKRAGRTTYHYKRVRDTRVTHTDTVP